MAANRHGTNGLPFLFLQRAALALHSTVYLNTWRHPRGGGIAPDPLKLISSQASERGNCLMKMDHGDGFTFHFVTAGIRLYYSQPSPLSSPSHTTHSGGSVYSLCILDLVPFFSGKAFACVYVFAAWMLKSSHGVKKPAWLAKSTGKCREIQPSSSWPHCSWSSCCVWSPVKWCPLSALNVTSPAHLWNNWTPHRWNGKKWIPGLVSTLFRWNSPRYTACRKQNGPVQVKMSS